MDIFDTLSLIGGLCLFLFGMNMMGQALERRAGSSLQGLLSKLTSNKLAGFLTGLGVTAVIQSSSATTVMVVGFANSGLMTLRQAINVIMGANVGITVTAWILSLGSISADNLFLKLLKPTSFTPILALIGIIFFMFCKSSKKKDTGVILLGFAVLMFGMDAMSTAVEGLRDVPAFQNLFVMFSNPLLGVLVGTLVTAIIQSSSASVGILQALTTTGQITLGTSIPIIMGQNIGTCVTAMLSSVGTTRNARRAAAVHLCFNIIGTTVLLTVFWVAKAFFLPETFLNASADAATIAIAHSAFNIACTVLLLPMSSLLEKLAYRIVPEKENAKPETISMLDERLLNTPVVALERCHELVKTMAERAIYAMRTALLALHAYTPALAEEVRAIEDETDHYEDMIGTYLIKLSAHQLGDHDSAKAAQYLKVIGDFERISDHAVNIIESAEELREKGIRLSDAAMDELNSLTAAVREILNLTITSFLEDDIIAAASVEPLEQIIDRCKEWMRMQHILRLQQGDCSVEAGFILSDLLTNLERTSDHCSNIAGCTIDVHHDSMNLHESLRLTRSESSEYRALYEQYAAKYLPYLTN